MLSTAVDKDIPKSSSEVSESNPISDETVTLIKEKRRLRRQYSQIKYPAVKTHINPLQKQIKDDIRVETQPNWEKMCNSISMAQNQELSQAKGSA